MKSIPRAALAGLVLCLALPATAGRPLSTEDATTLDDGACQLESWIDRPRAGATQRVAVPACAWLGIEAQFGTTWARDEGRTRLSAQFVQAKHAFRNVDDGAWGIALVAGVTRDRLRETRSDRDNPYIVVPFSMGVGEDKDTRALVHLNLGTTRDRAQSRNATTWGIAFEKPVTGRLTILGEFYGENARDPFHRFGGRYTLIADHLDVDLTYVGRSGGTREDRLWSLGFHLETASFLKRRAPPG